MNLICKYIGHKFISTLVWNYKFGPNIIYKSIDTKIPFCKRCGKSIIEIRGLE